MCVGGGVTDCLSVCLTHTPSPSSQPPPPFRRVYKTSADPRHLTLPTWCCRGNQLRPGSTLFEPEISEKREERRERGEMGGSNTPPLPGRDLYYKVGVREALDRLPTFVWAHCGNIPTVRLYLSRFSTPKYLQKCLLAT